LTDSRLSPFGRVLRRWRQARGMSQLALATSASTTTRHLSFLETGRAERAARWSCAAHALDVPLRERNALLGAAGFAPLYRESPLDAPGMSALQRMLDFTLSRFDPFPAFLVDRCYRVLRVNQAAGRTLASFAGDGAPWREQPRTSCGSPCTRKVGGRTSSTFGGSGGLAPRAPRARGRGRRRSELAALERELRALPDLPSRALCRLRRSSSCHCT
jgi:transcriptional regulator with XRE-family HTH domain